LPSRAWRRLAAGWLPALLAILGIGFGVFDAF
jgi:hypothetical protein